MRASALLFLSFFAPFAHGQDTLRVMAYNLLHFPDPVPAGRADTLAHILAWHPVDILICEEMRTAEGAQSVLDDALNVDGTDRFSMAEFVVQQKVLGYQRIKLKIGRGRDIAYVAAARDALGSMLTRSGGHP